MKRALLIALTFVPCLVRAEPSDITDPAGTVWTVGTPGWHFWSGFGTGLAFYAFGFIKRFAQRAGGNHSDF